MLWIAGALLTRVTELNPFFYTRLTSLTWCVFVVCCAVLQITGAVYWDAVGSIAVSALLGVVAITLIQRNRKWLIGKSMPKVTTLHPGFCLSCVCYCFFAKSAFSRVKACHKQNSVSCSSNQD